jgi:biopolymer transport protein ExbD
MNFSRRQSVEPEINVTSLIDVVLLLVLFFMVSTSFVQDGRLKVRLPESSADAERRAVDPIVIAVTVNGDYHVNGRALANQSPETLRLALERSGQPAKSTAVTIRADAQASHQAVVTAMDVVGRLGYAQVNIATVTQTEAR